MFTETEVVRGIELRRLRERIRKLTSRRRALQDAVDRYRLLACSVDSKRSDAMFASFERQMKELHGDLIHCLRQRHYGLLHDVIYKRDRLVARSEPNNRPWDEWKRRAIKAGVSRKLAALGRKLMKTAYDDRWNSGGSDAAGWDDAGALLISMALENPTLAKAEWEQHLEWGGLIPF